MVSHPSPIKDVSDTALWVAHYRSLETKRSDALFSDIYSEKLVGERGRHIADVMSKSYSAAHTQFNVVVRTVIIDRFLQRLISEGADCILNLGAGLDTRPYRLELPASLHWIEVDYPHVIALKEQVLGQEVPKCRLQRVPFDLTESEKRRTLFERINSQFSNVVVLTEGVLPYLTPEQVTELSQTIFDQNHFSYWITDYISPAAYKYLRSPKRMKQMKNAPFQFYPTDWFGFFENLGWKVDSIEYLQEEGLKLGRPLPMPWFAKWLSPFFPKKMKEQFLRASGYMLLKSTVSKYEKTRG